MPDISEAGFDQSYAARLNDASMGQALLAFSRSTQVEDEEARGWLVNGIFSSMPGALRPTSAQKRGPPQQQSVRPGVLRVQLMYPLV